MAEEFSLSSSWLAGGSYDEETLTLTLTTQKGDEYTLNGVPPEVAEGLKEAASPGAYFARHLKGRY